MNEETVELTMEQQRELYYDSMSLDALETEKKNIDEAIEEISILQRNFNALVSLSKNDDWKVFTEMYCDDERDRISSALTGTQSFRAETETQLQQKLLSIRHFKLFLRSAEAESANSEEQLAMFRESLVSITAHISSRKK